MENFVKKKFILIIFLSLFISCGLSKEELSQGVRDSMQQTFNTNADYKEYKLQVSSVDVIQESENKFKGIAHVNFDGSIHDVPVEITVDGKQFMWNSEPGAFTFIATKEMEKIQKQAEKDLEQYQKQVAKDMENYQKIQKQVEKDSENMQKQLQKILGN